MGQIIEPELVVSSWPFRLGTIVYDPVLRIDVAAWDLDEIAEAPEWIGVAAKLLNPAAPYTKRKQALVSTLGHDQELLRAVYQVGEGEDVTIDPVPSDDVERELGVWLKERGLRFEDIALGRLTRLLDTLAEWDAERHHAFCADWWETFERPSGETGPSAFRIDAAPGGALYTARFDGETALAAWRSDVEDPTFETFSLWEALRTHWAWRFEFADQPKPRYAVLDRVRSLFA